MESKDDLISRKAALDIVAKDSGMAGTYDQIEALPGQMTAAEAWENRLKVGDVVKYAPSKRKGVVVAVCNPNSGLHRILFQDGISCGCYGEHLRKTGKTIDIQSVLEQLKE